MENINLNILIVEDEEKKVKSIISFINSLKSNLTIEVIDNQIDSLNILAQKKFDLLILDMCLPLRSGEELEELGGKNILDELNTRIDYKRPSTIITLTQFDTLQDEVRNKFPELGAIKYTIGQNDWQEGLKRVIDASIKSKAMQRVIIYCEHKNDSLYNSIGLENIEFRGLTGGSRKVYEYAKFEKENYSVRDKDFLTRNEVKWLTNKFQNYFILEYYCFENYLFHPDNLEEYFNGKADFFNKKNYLKEIIKQKNDKLIYIAEGLRSARNSYYDFTDNQKNNMDDSPEIIECLKSDVFELFYQYFDMKGTNKDKGFDKSYLSNYNIRKEELVVTNWFANKMRKLFSKVLS